MSPVVFRHRGYSFRFYSNEGKPREPVHVHVVRHGQEAKFWLWPEVTVAYNDGIDERAMREFIGIVRERREEIEHAWRDFFGEAD